MLVFGLGGVGMAAVQAGRAVGATQIIMVDPVAERRELAAGFGATDAFEDLSAGRGLRTVLDARVA